MNKLVFLTNSIRLVAKTYLSLEIASSMTKKLNWPVNNNLGNREGWLHWQDTDLGPEMPMHIENRMPSQVFSLFPSISGI